MTNRSNRRVRRTPVTRKKRCEGRNFGVSRDLCFAEKDDPKSRWEVKVPIYLEDLDQTKKQGDHKGPYPGIY